MMLFELLSSPSSWLKLMFLMLEITAGNSSMLTQAALYAAHTFLGRLELSSCLGRTRIPAGTQFRPYELPPAYNWMNSSETYTALLVASAHCHDPSCNSKASINFCSFS
ncbi:hypothetical protein V1506DRAFT_544821 [Lipomyces tetrasporus]